MCMNCLPRRCPVENSFGDAFRVREMEQRKDNCAGYGEEVERILGDDCGDWEIVVEDRETDGEVNTNGQSAWIIWMDAFGFEVLVLSEVSRAKGRFMEISCEFCDSWMGKFPSKPLFIKDFCISAWVFSPRAEQYTLQCRPHRQVSKKEVDENMSAGKLVSFVKGLIFYRHRFLLEFRITYHDFPLKNTRLCLEYAVWNLRISLN